MALDRLHRLIDSLPRLPVVGGVLRARMARRFRRPMGHAFFGDYPTFEAAAAAVPPGLPSSYDSRAGASMYVDWTDIDDYDPPLLLWLREAVGAGARRIVDLGGSVGIKYYAFRQVLPWPADWHWQVIELPAVVALGQQLAIERGVAGTLGFADHPSAADGADVLIASGSLQYLPQTLGEILAGLRRLPKWLLVNTTPIHPTRSFFTLNNIGVACCPYRVIARQEFLAMVTAHGYRCRAEWRNVGKRLDLPFSPGLALDHYSGFCFDLAQPQASPVSSFGAVALGTAPGRNANRG